MVRQTRLRPSPGPEGGEAGKVARTTVNTSAGTFEPDQETHIHFEVEAGDRVTHVIGGACGQGYPSRASRRACWRTSSTAGSAWKARCGTTEWW